MDSTNGAGPPEQDVGVQSDHGVTNISAIPKTGISFLDALKRRSLVDVKEDHSPEPGGFRGFPRRSLVPVGPVSDSEDDTTTDDESEGDEPSRHNVINTRRAYVPPPPSRPSQPSQSPSSPISNSDSDEDLIDHVRHSVGTVAPPFTPAVVRHNASPPPSRQDRTLLQSTSPSRPSHVPATPTRSPPVPASLMTPKYTPSRSQQDEYKVVLEKTPGKKLGIGIGEKENGLTVMNILPGSLADGHGIASGSIIAEVNGRSMKSSPKREFVELVSASTGNIEFKFLIPPTDSGGDVGPAANEANPQPDLQSPKLSSPPPKKIQDKSMTVNISPTEWSVVAPPTKMESAIEATPEEQSEMDVSKSIRRAENARQLAMSMSNSIVTKPTEVLTPTQASKSMIKRKKSNPFAVGALAQFEKKSALNSDRHVGLNSQGTTASRLTSATSHRDSIPFMFLNESVIDSDLEDASSAVDDIYETTSFSDPECQTFDVQNGRRVNIRRGAAGLGLQIETTPEGTQIIQLNPNGPAAQSNNVHIGDWLLAVNGQKVGSDHHDILASLAATVDVELLLKGNGPTKNTSETTSPTQKSFSKISTPQDAKRIAFKSMTFTRRLSSTFTDDDVSVPGSPRPGAQLPDVLYSLDGNGHQSSTQSPPQNGSTTRRAAAHEIESPKKNDSGPLEVKLLVQPRDRFTHTISIEDKSLGLVIAWQYTLHNAALYFSLEIEPSSGDPRVEYVTPSLVEKSEKSNRGTWNCGQGGKYKLHFANKSNTTVSISLRCSVIDMAPWLDRSSQLSSHGLVHKRSALDISPTMVEEPLFNLEIFELEAIVKWINENVDTINIKLIGMLHEREGLQEIHDELDYRAHGLSKRVKTKSIPTSRGGRRSAKVQPKQQSPPKQVLPPRESPEVPKRVNIEPVALPLELSPLMRAGFEYLSQPWALAEVGLFRVSGSLKQILDFETRFQNASVSGKPAELCDCFEPATVCGLMKRAFQKEKLPLSPTEGQLLVEILLADEDAVVKESRFIAAVWDLPTNHSACLKCLVWLFAKIIDQPANKMNATNLGISVGLTVFPTVELQYCDVLITYMVDLFDTIWPEDLASSPRHGSVEAHTNVVRYY